MTRHDVQKKMENVRDFDPNSKKLNNKQRKELKRIDWDIVKRILEMLWCEGTTKKTRIAMKCNLNHEQITMYLDWIDLFDFIKRQTNVNKGEWIDLSERGREFYIRRIDSIRNHSTVEFSQMRNLSS